MPPDGDPGMTTRHFRSSPTSLTLAVVVAFALVTAPAAHAAPGSTVTFGDPFVAAPSPLTSTTTPSRRSPPASRRAAWHLLLSPEQEEAT